MTDYQRDILSQPQALQDTLTALAEYDPGLGGLAQRLQDGEFRQVVLTGMGSSFYAFHPLQQALVRMGIPAFMLETGELIHSLPGLLRSDSLVIAASQSGQSAEIVHLCQRLSAPGAPALLGVSNTSGSPLAEHSQVCLLSRAGDEASVSCKTYLATLCVLAWLEPLLTGAGPAALAARLQELALAPGLVAAYLEHWQDHVRQLTTRLEGVHSLFITGRGPSLAAAGVGGLTTKESTHVHAEGMSSAAFRHGPLEMVRPEIFVLVFAGMGSSSQLNRRLAADIQAAGGRVGLVETGGAGPLGLPMAPASLLPLLEILPVQMMTLALAGLHGHPAGQFTRAAKVTADE